MSKLALTYSLKASLLSAMFSKFCLCFSDGLPSLPLLLLVYNFRINWLFLLFIFLFFLYFLLLLQLLVKFFSLLLHIGLQLEIFLFQCFIIKFKLLHQLVDLFLEYIKFLLALLNHFSFFSLS